MKLTHMKEPAQSTKPSPAKRSGPSYPWGLSINLDEPALAKLGIKGHPAGKINLTARGHVTNASTNTDAAGKSSRSASFQITHLALGSAPGAKTVKRVATKAAAVKAPVKLTRVKGK